MGNPPILIGPKYCMLDPTVTPIHSMRDATMSQMKHEVTRQEGKKTKVVYFTGLFRRGDYEIPVERVETDLILFGQKFGVVVKVLVIPGKGQGFLEFETLQESERCVNFVNKERPVIMICGERSAHFGAQFSNKSEIVSNKSSRASERRHHSGRADSGRDRNSRSYSSHVSSRYITSGMDDRHPNHTSQSLPGPRSITVNMEVRIDADGTMTPLGDPWDYAHLFPQLGETLERQRPHVSGRRGDPGRDSRALSRSPRSHLMPRKPLALVTCYGPRRISRVTILQSFSEAMGTLSASKKARRIRTNAG